VSYSRFGWDHSDVYTFEHVGGGLECCGCALHPVSVRFTDVAEFCRHLDEHTAAGHTVPADVIPAVLADHAAGEFAGWDTTGDPARLAPWTDHPAPPEVTVVEFYERNRHMLGDHADELIAGLRREDTR
jgi:hypothetical protein